MSKFEDTTTKSVQKRTFYACPFTFELPLLFNLCALSILTTIPLVLLVHVIGAPLQSLLEFDGQRRTLPLILKNCLDALRDDESIPKSRTLFRGVVAGNEEVEKAEEEFSSPNLNVNLQRYDADTIALLLLDWLSKLAEPLLSESKMAKFEAAYSKYGTEDPKKRGKKLAQVIKSLPSTHSNVLQYLIHYLSELSSHAQVNLLTPVLLASIFAPVLTHSFVPHCSSNSSHSSSNTDASQSHQQASTSSGTRSPRSSVAAEHVVALLIFDYPVIFADFNIEDRETIPEDQLADDVPKVKRKSLFFRSNSGSIDKSSLNPNRKPMVLSSSAEHLAIAKPDSPSISPASSATTITTTKVDKPADKSTPAAPPTPASAPQPDDQEKDEKKKGLKSTLRKFGFGKDKKDKEKTPNRNRSSSAASPSSSPQVSRSAAPNGSPLPQHASEEPVNPSAVFGMPFERLLVLDEAGAPDRILPNILVDSFAYLKDESRSKEFGVFRESGSFNEKASLKKAYDSPAVRIDFEGVDGYTVAALAKEWLRALPECLLTEKLYQEFKDAVAEGEEAESNHKLKTAISHLPEPRRNALHFIIYFFKNYIVARSADNKMGANNVGIVIGPCLHRKANPSPDELMDPCHNLIVVHMLNAYDEIFGGWSVPEPTEDAPGTIHKKASELDKAVSVLDDINKKVASAQAAQAEAAAVGVAVEEAGSGSGASSSSPDRNGSPDNGKLKERKRKGSGIFEIWDRFKEETSGSGRKRSSTMQTDRAPFGNERSPISRSISTKQGSAVESGTHPPRSPITRSLSTKQESTPSAIAGDVIALDSSSTTTTTITTTAYTTASTATADDHESGALVPSTSSELLHKSNYDSSSSSAPPSPKNIGTHSRQSSGGSGINLRIVTAVTSDSSHVNPSSTGSDGDFPVAEAAPTSGKRSKRLSRLRELSVGSSGSTAADWKSVDSLSTLSAPLIETWLSENALGDLIPGLKHTTGKQLCTFSKADLKDEFGLRGVALWNTIHPADSQEEASLGSQVSKLTIKLEELLTRMAPTAQAATAAPSETSAALAPAASELDQNAASASTPAEHDVTSSSSSSSFELVSKRTSLTEAMSAVLTANVRVASSSSASLDPEQTFGEAPQPPPSSSELSHAETSSAPPHESSRTPSEPITANEPSQVLVPETTEAASETNEAVSETTIGPSETSEAPETAQEAAETTVTANSESSNEEHKAPSNTSEHTRFPTHDAPPIPAPSPSHPEVSEVHDVVSNPSAEHAVPHVDGSLVVKPPTVTQEATAHLGISISLADLELAGEAKLNDLPFESVDHVDGHHQGDFEAVPLPQIQIVGATPREDGVLAPAE